MQINHNHLKSEPVMTGHFTTLLMLISAFFGGVSLGLTRLEAQEHRAVARPQNGNTRSFSLPVFNRASARDATEEAREPEGTRRLEVKAISEINGLFEGTSSRTKARLHDNLSDSMQFLQDPIDSTTDIAPLELPPTVSAQDPDRAGPTIGRRPLRRPLSDVDIDIHTKGKRLPDDRAQSAIDLDVVTWSNTLAAGTVFGWEAPEIRYRKLYFEDVPLERYGQVPNGIFAQELRSAIHWGGTLLALPLNMRLDPYYDCDTPLGFCRPGDCVPPTFQRFLRR